MDAQAGLSDATLSAVKAETARAIAKHGVLHSAIGPGSDLYKLAILGEEFGEVCHALTYDSGEGLEELYKELVQVSSVAAGWAQTVYERILQGAINAVSSET